MDLECLVQSLSIDVKRTDSWTKLIKELEKPRDNKHSKSTSQKPMKTLEEKTKKVTPKSLKIQESKLSLPLREKPANVRYEVFIPTQILPYDVFISEEDEEKRRLLAKKGTHELVAKMDKQPGEPAYQFSVVYDAKNQGLQVTYVVDTYTDRIDKARVDFTSKLDKFLEIIPKTWMGGVLGFTYLGSGKMARRDDLFG